MLLVISSGVAEFLRGANITGKGKRTKGNNHQNKKRSHNSTCSSVHRKTMSSPPESQKEQAAKEDNSADVEQAEEQALPSDEKPNEKKSLMAGCTCSRKAQMIGLCVLILVGVVVAAVLSSRAPLVSAPPVSSDNDDVGIDSPVVGSTLNAQWGKFRCKADSECAPDEFCEYDIGCLPIKDDVCEEDGCGSNVSPDGNECGWGDAKNQMDYLFVRQKNKPPGCTYCHHSWYSKKYCVWKKALGDECKHNYECMTEYCSWSSPKHCTTRW